MLKKYGRIIFLGILLLVVTELTIYVNNYVDKQTTQNEHEQVVEKLREALAHSTADLTNLNPYTEFWVQELEYFRTEYPAADTKAFKNVNMEEWNASIDNLSNEIQTENIDNVTMMGKVKQLIKDTVGMNYLLDVFSEDIDDGYFRSILYLMEDDEKKK